MKKNLKRKATSVALSMLLPNILGFSNPLIVKSEDDTDELSGEIIEEENIEEEKVANLPIEESIDTLKLEKNSNELEKLENNTDIELEEELEENEDEDIEETENAVENNKENDYKTAVYTDKLNENNVALEGAVLQILDSEGNVLDEWLSTEESHLTMLPKGDYILHEKEAPEGYKIADDINFSVEVDVLELNAGVVHDANRDVCWHYKGVPLYFVENNGEKEEVYCVNQGLDEPNNINYDGEILDDSNIKIFTPDSDPNMTDLELYNKVLDVIYHRNRANEVFTDLTETEIRYITEYALKNYTSTMVEDGGLFRKFRYDPTSKSKFVVDDGNGSALGQLAKHWWYFHGRKTIPDKYAELYYYLISEDDPHPEDMHLFMFSTTDLTTEGEKYQNLLGVRWFDPYKEDYVTYVTMVDEKELEPVPSRKINPPTPEEEIPIVEVENNIETPTPKNEYRNIIPNTSDSSQLYNYYLFLLSSAVASGSIIILHNDKKNRKNTNIRKRVK